MRPSRLIVCFVMVLLCQGYFPQCAIAQFLGKAVHGELCGIAQQYIDELNSLLARSSHTSYPAVEATDIHVKHQSKFWSVLKARCPDCDHGAWLQCREFISTLSTAIRRWGESHFPGLLTQPDATKKIKAELLGFCPDLVIPTLEEGNGKIGREKR
jgi:hypothetical protein